MGLRKGPPIGIIANFSTDHKRNTGRYSLVLKCDTIIYHNLCPLVYAGEENEKNTLLFAICRILSRAMGSESNNVVRQAYG